MLSNRILRWNWINSTVLFGLLICKIREHTKNNTIEGVNDLIIYLSMWSSQEQKYSNPLDVLEVGSEYAREWRQAYDLM